MKDRKIRVIASVLIIALSVFCLVGILPQNKVEPDNPLITKADTLRTEISTQSGGASGQTEESVQQGDFQNPDQSNQDKENQDTGEDREEQTQEEQNTPENQGQTGDNNSEHPGIDDKGDIPDDNGEQDTEQPGNGDNPGENEDGLITDLYSRILTVPELQEDTLNFYAYYSDTSVKADIKVNYRHESENGNGKWIVSENNRDYETKLKLGKNYITIYYTDKDGQRDRTRIVITYQAEKADASRPEVGENPPMIETNLDGWTGDINTSEFTVTVSAKTWKGERIYSDSIQVMMDGKTVTNPTGSGVYEYVLQFERPKVGDYENHTVSVLAWDSEGNSRYVEYQIRYQFHNDGEKLGTVRVVIDATTVECGIVDEGEIELQAGDTAASVVLKMLEEYGYECQSSGADSSEFYLASISRADAFRGCHIGERLKGLLERDGATFTSAGSRDQLGEFDFTRGSGWMYFINGSICPGKAMSAWTLNGGETISLRYTLAYGKDVGGTSASEGTLTSYCAQWIDGQIVELGHDYRETSRVEPGTDTDGYIEYTCSKCGETKQERLPATGGEPEVPSQPGEEGKPEIPSQPGEEGEPEIPSQPVEE